MSVPGTHVNLFKMSRKPFAPYLKLMVVCVALAGFQAWLADGITSKVAWAALSALFVALVSRRLCKAPRAALAAAVLYGTSAFAVLHINEPSQAQLGTGLLPRAHGLFSSLSVAGHFVADFIVGRVERSDPLFVTVSAWGLAIAALTIMLSTRALVLKPRKALLCILWILLAGLALPGHGVELAGLVWLLVLGLEPYRGAPLLAICSIYAVLGIFGSYLPVRENRKKAESFLAYARTVKPIVVNCAEKRLFEHIIDAKDELSVRTLYSKAPPENPPPVRKIEKELSHWLRSRARGKRPVLLIDRECRDNRWSAAVDPADSFGFDFLERKYEIKRTAYRAVPFYWREYADPFSWFVADVYELKLKR